MKERKAYKDIKTNNNSMLPGDLKRSPDDCFIFIDDGFLSKLSKYFGGGKYLKFDKVSFAMSIANKQNFNCKHIYYYLAPPFQSPKPTVDEINRKENHDKFVKSISQNTIITIREGRCQRIKNKESEFIFKQKAVDSLMIIDLMSIPIKHKDIKKIILIASDSDFVPAVEELKNLGLEIVLYTYYVKKRDTGLSRSNYLMKAVSRYVKLSKEDFINSPFVKNKGEKKTW